jgi:hypothetical protein
MSSTPDQSSKGLFSTLLSWEPLEEDLFRELSLRSSYFLLEIWSSCCAQLSYKLQSWSLLERRHPKSYSLLSNCRSEVWRYHLWLLRSSSSQRSSMLLRNWLEQSSEDQDWERCSSERSTYEHTQVALAEASSQHSKEEYPWAKKGYHAL